MRIQRCRSCRWFSEGESLATCHRYPPAVIGGFPVVADDDYCGEHRQPDRKKKGDHQQAPKSETGPAIKYYLDSFERKYGGRPRIEAQDGAAIKRFLQSHTIEAWMWAVDSWMESPIEWYAARSLNEPRYIVKEYNRLISRRKDALQEARREGVTRDKVNAFLSEMAVKYAVADRWEEYKGYVLTEWHMIGYEEWELEFPE